MHPKFRTPWVISIIVTAIVAVVAGFTPIGLLEEMVNIGTLSAFVLVSVGVIVLRRKRPDLPRSFRVPFNPWLPGLSALICIYLMLNLTRRDLAAVPGLARRSASSSTSPTRGSARASGSRATSTSRIPHVSRTSGTTAMGTAPLIRGPDGGVGPAGIEPTTSTV